MSGKLGIKAHAHHGQHACGYKLANDGHNTRAIHPISANGWILDNPPPE